LKTRQIETFIQEIRDGAPVSLELDPNVRLDADIGTDALLTQAIATWSRNRKGRPARLILPSGFESIEAIRDATFFDSLPGLASIYFSDEIQSGTKLVPRENFLRAIAPSVKAMQQGGYDSRRRRGEVLLCCFGGAPLEFVAPLYDFPRQRGVRETQDFIALLRKVFRELGSTTKIVVREDQLEFVASLARELFLNADEHGSDDVEGIRFSRSIRGMVFKLVDLSDSTTFATDASLQTYLAGLKVTPTKTGRNPAGPIGLVEVSVFDTGPGLALRWLAGKSDVKRYDDFTVDAELEAVQTCFGKHATTKASSYSGIGLTKVLQSVRELNAFTAVRTGRVSLIQHMSNERREEFKPMHRFPGRKQLGEVAGAAYSLVFRAE
jgi:hypothetical protein